MSEVLGYWFSRGEGSRYGFCYRLILGDKLFVVVVVGGVFIKTKKLWALMSFYSVFRFCVYG